MSNQNNYLGRCAGCDYALFATGDDVKSADTFKGILAGQGAFKVQGKVFGRCDKGHAFFPLKRVEGTFSDVHQCDSRCLNARGHHCTCSCGGANHGRGHAVVIAQVTTPVVAPVTSVHIGEIGKYITGTATIVGKREGVGQYNNTLLSFTTKTGSVLKWFAPHSLGDTYEQGQELTFRAKVKAHDEFRGVAQTIVTYLEEI